MHQYFIFLASSQGCLLENALSIKSPNAKMHDEYAKIVK